MLHRPGLVREKLQRSQLCYIDQSQLDKILRVPAKLHRTGRVREISNVPAILYKPGVCKRKIPRMPYVLLRQGPDREKCVVSIYAI